MHEEASRTLGVHESRNNNNNNNTYEKLSILFSHLFRSLGTFEDLLIPVIIGSVFRRGFNFLFGIIRETQPQNAA